MSKCKGEFLTLDVLQQKGYDPMVYRLFCLQSHYRKALVFSYEGMDNAASAYQKLIARIAGLRQKDGVIDEQKAAPLRAEFAAALDNDLNTSLAITALYDALKAPVNDATRLALIREFDQVLSLGLLQAAAAYAAAPAQESDAQIDELLAQRAQARKERDFARADAIRDQLTVMGIVVEDTKDGAIWHRK